MDSDKKMHSKNARKNITNKINKERLLLDNMKKQP